MLLLLFWNDWVHDAQRWWLGGGGGGGWWALKTLKSAGNKIFGGGRLEIFTDYEPTDLTHGESVIDAIPISSSNRGGGFHLSHRDLHEKRSWRFLAAKYIILHTVSLWLLVCQFYQWIDTSTWYKNRYKLYFGLLPWHFIFYELSSAECLKGQGRLTRWLRVLFSKRKSTLPAGYMYMTLAIS